MFNILLFSNFNRTGKSTCAKNLSRLLQMPQTSGGDLLRLFALESKNGFDRNFLVKDFLRTFDLNKLFEKYGNLSSEEFVAFHKNEAEKDASYDIDIDRYLLERLKQGGWVVDSVIGGIIINKLLEKDSKVYDEFIEFGSLTYDDAKKIKENTFTIFLTADMDERSKRSAFYEEIYGFKTSKDEEKTKLETREGANNKRYKKLYDIDINECSNFADLTIDTTDLMPKDVCMKVINASEKVRERIKELGIQDVEAKIDELMKEVKLAK